MQELAEERRLRESQERTHNWKRWGPYLSDRQWATVREDYSPYGDSWGYFTHDQSRSRVYRWGEDGLLGITDRQCRLCFALALWNHKDHILKERLFGLTGPEGNHGEDVKECYYFLDSTPTHSYMKALYKYPQREFPYQHLLDENARRDRSDPEFELIDTRIFAENRYFDVGVEYCKANPDDILIRLTVHNQGPDPARLEVLPTVWFRNVWGWGRSGEGFGPEPSIALEGDGARLDHCELGSWRFEAEKAEEWLFTNNETNRQLLYEVENPTPYVKDAFHRYLINREAGAVNPAHRGTKCAARYSLKLEGGAKATLRLRLFSQKEKPRTPFGTGFDKQFNQSLQEANEFYSWHGEQGLNAAEQSVWRQAIAGLLWSKRFFYYAVDQWLEGDPSQPAPPEQRRHGRNAHWAKHLYNRDVLLMPDSWEYPWYAAWDLAFHVHPLAKIDPDLAKEQLLLLLREWYMHPNGQIPAYEFSFDDVNPPVHAWAALRLYRACADQDRAFLEKIFHKLLLNFTWWVNRTDVDGNNVFTGGFLGLDNVGVFDRSRFPKDIGELEQADATAWMAFFSLRMLQIAMELASQDPVYEDVASKFFEHFVAITDSINDLGQVGLWDEEDGFYYDVIRTGDSSFSLNVRSMVGLLPLIAVEILDKKQLARMPGFTHRMNWFLANRPQLSTHIASTPDKFLLSVVPRDRLIRVLEKLLSEDEFLSPYGIRSLSKYHQANPYVLRFGGQEYRVDYEPGESASGMFGGNSNWRGPVWFPVNYLLIEGLKRASFFYGNDLQVECPTGSGVRRNLMQVAQFLQERLTWLFLPDPDGDRPCHGGERLYRENPGFRDLALFYEYFDGDTGRGLGASHQTGWTALVARLLESVAKVRNGAKPGRHALSGA